MATVNLILDTRGKKPSVKMQLCVGTRNVAMSLGILLETKDQWLNGWSMDSMAGPVVGHKSARVYNNICRSRLAMAQDVLVNLMAKHGKNGITIDILKDAVMLAIDPGRAAREEEERKKAEIREKSVMSAFRTVMAEKESMYKTGRGSERNWELYETTLRRLREYAEDIAGSGTPEDYERISNGGLPSDKAEEYLEALQFESIDNDWIDGWVECMSDTAGAATRRIYLSTFRAVCNWAYRHDYVLRPVFRNYKIEAKEADIEPIDNATFRALMSCDLTDMPEVESHRDMAWFGFCTIGMNIVDAHKLTNKDIKNGYMTYIRSKTHRKYTIKLEPEAVEIIHRLSNKDESEGAKVFDWAVRYKKHNNYTKRMNNFGLRRIGSFKYVGRGGKKEWSPIYPTLHYYQFRHTWACMAAELDIPKDIIALCLGHGKKTVTDVYVRYEQRKIDEANRKVIDYALKVINGEIE